MTVTKLFLPVADAARIFALLADPTRLCVVQALSCKDECCATDLARACDSPRPTLSHHLRLLLRAGVVACRREGRHHHYSLTSPFVRAILGFVQ